MAAAVTYNGVPGGEGGTIFQGIKFWVAQRVPMRAELLKHIKVCTPRPLSMCRYLQANRAILGLWCR